MFDTHCHLNLKEFDGQLTPTINAAREAGVKQFLIPGVDLESSKKALQIAEDYEHVYAAAGMHPTEDLENTDLVRLLYQCEELATTSLKVLAIGEIGLDYFRYEAGTATQKTFFEAQLKLAMKLTLPAIVHNRHATQDILGVITALGPAQFSKKLIFHCCPAEKELLDFATQYEIYIGVDGDVTYDAAKQAFVKDIPLSLLLLETDSPYLVPEPHKSQKIFPNTPAHLVDIAKKIAEIKHISYEEVVKATTQNAKEVFKLNQNVRR